jgi:RNA-directed DNA polymerase
VHSIPSASVEGSNDVHRYTRRMIEMVVSRKNMTEAYKRVATNNENHGIGYIKVD